MSVCPRFQHVGIFLFLQCYILFTCDPHRPDHRLVKVSVSVWILSALPLIYKTITFQLELLYTVTNLMGQMCFQNVDNPTISVLSMCIGTLQILFIQH